MGPGNANTGENGFPFKSMRRRDLLAFFLDFFEVLFSGPAFRAFVGGLVAIGQPSAGEAPPARHGNHHAIPSARRYIYVFILDAGGGI